MDAKELQDLIEQLSQQRAQKPGGRTFGVSNDYNSPGAVSQWLWGSGYSGVGPLQNNAPPIVHQMLQQPGMKMDPTQYRSVGGYTGQFASALNQALYPGMNMRQGEQSMGDIIGQQMQKNSTTQLSPEEEDIITQALQQRRGMQYGL